MSDVLHYIVHMSVAAGLTERFSFKNLLQKVQFNGRNEVFLATLWMSDENWLLIRQFCHSSLMFNIHFNWHSFRLLDSQTFSNTTISVQDIWYESEVTRFQVKELETVKPFNLDNHFQNISSKKLTFFGVIHCIRTRLRWYERDRWLINSI